MTAMTAVSIVPDWLWVAFSVGVLSLLILDLGVFHRKPKKITVGRALGESAFWILVALAFNAWFASAYGGKLGLEFLTGYLIEKSLSVDNLFVIFLIFSAFRIPSEYQHRVLFFGILGAILMRGALIIVGAQLVHSFHWILYVFGGILLYTSYKFLFGSDEDMDVHEHWAMRQLKRFVHVTPHFDGQKFFILEDGIRKATPLMAALLIIEATDLVFAVDSIPAVFSVTQDAFVAFASNILAVLGLRALYFVIADMVAKLRYLKPGLALILGFIGVKMLIIDIVHIPSWLSLIVISFILTTAGLSSWYVGRVERLQAERKDALEPRKPPQGE